MNYCPGCQESLQTDAEACPYCGYELMPTAEEETGLPEISTKKPLYKRAVFLVPLIFLIILGILAGGGFAGYRYYQVQKKDDFQKELKSIWSEVSNRSKYMAGNISMLKTPHDLENLKGDLADFSEFLTSKQSQASNLEAVEGLEDNQAALVRAIEKYANYVYLLKLVLQKEPSAVEPADYAKTEAYSEEAEAASQKFVAEAAFIDDSLQADLFSALEKIRPIISKVKNTELAKKSEELKQQQSEAKKLAERTVRSFMQARIDQSGAEMRRYITPGYDNVFNPEQEFAVTDTYSIDFKITATRAVSDEVFNIRGTETGKDITGANFENKWWFQVIKYEGDWLIDSRRLLNK